MSIAAVMRPMKRQRESLPSEPESAMLAGGTMLGDGVVTVPLPVAPGYPELAVPVAPTALLLGLDGYGGDW